VNRRTQLFKGLSIVGLATCAAFASSRALGGADPFEYFFDWTAATAAMEELDGNPEPDDPPKFPIKDKQAAGPEENSGGSFDFQDPANIEKTVEYNPDSHTYNFIEKIGDRYFRNPTSMSFDEYYKYRTKQDEQDYFGERLRALSMFNSKPDLPEMSKEGVFDRLFGSTKLKVEPQGNLTVSAGILSQNLQNPNIPKRNQKYTIPDFDMQMNINLVAQIGDKMKLNISNNTMSNFGDMQEMRRLEYIGKEDEIIKKIELGNTSFPLRSTLTPGVNSLFGLKVQSQWGKLMMTNVISQQRSQRRSMTSRGGALTQPFEIQINDYEENKHFLLGQHFYQNYDRALANFPIINSQVVINKVEVWITNRTGATQGIRDALAFMDLGEADPYNQRFRTGSTTALPANTANSLYNNLYQSPLARTQASATQGALSLGLKEGDEFQRVTVRKLNENEYTFHPQLGYISLVSMTPSADDVIAVAYRYTYNGQVYQVGEFSEDLPPDNNAQKVIFLKLLKGTAHRVNLPIWDLMMKNIYSIQGMNINKDRFRLNVVYQDPGGGNKRFLPEGPNAGVPIISLLNLDRLNPQNDPYPDGVFDFVEDITINSRNGKIIFPTLEPFGSTLRPALGNDPNLERKYLYQILYDSTKAVAIQQQQNNRFLIKGEFQTVGGGAEIRLNGFNIPQGSVTVNIGGQTLSEGADYTVDYNMGVVRILNQGLLQSGQDINISYEDNGTFGQNLQNFTGTRLDYFANEKLTLGATYMRLSERPYTQKVTSGYDPIKNTVLGADINYQSEAPWLTRMLDKIPFYSTSAPSLISGSAEVAGIFPGHHKFVDLEGDDGGTNYVDDFEGAGSGYDIRYPAMNWSLASTPRDAVGPNNNILFPEAALLNDLRSGMNRANLSWYIIEPTLNDGSASAPPSVTNDTRLQDYWRQVDIQEVFPNQDRTAGNNILSTLDLTFNPNLRGPYNFDATNIDPTTGNLLNPASRWGGIQRFLDQSDFEQNNVEYITFWALDPFIGNPNSKGGYLYFNLGNVSEDVLKDSRLSFENGITYPKDLSQLDASVWGYVPKFQQQIVRAFEQDPAARAVQDVGYDALDDSEEAVFFSSFLAQMGNVLGVGSPAYQKLLQDPASDNFKHFLDPEHETNEAGVLERYRYFNNPHGNSPVLSGNNSITSAGTSYPESEDINRDNTLNETEAYYQYRVKLEPNMDVGSNYIVNKQVSTVTLPDKTTSVNTWYQFKIPVKEYDAQIGGISDFRNIRFVRIFMNGFEDPVTVRFAQLQLDRSNWRRYNFSLINPGENIPEEDQKTTNFGITQVNVIQNSKRTPIPYVSPPGIQRQQQMATTGQILRADEQSLALQICGLKDGDARAAFKEFGISMRQYKQLKMNIHAESVVGQPDLRDGDLIAFIRVGSDYVRNYYEFQVQLQITQPGPSINAEAIWPKANNMEMYLEDLINLKNARNAANFSSTLPYEGVDRNGRIIKVIGSPNFEEVKNIMLGVLNPKRNMQNPADDGLEKCVEVWFNELRNVGSDERAGYASTAQLNVQLADLGTVHLGGTMHTKGYGSIDQRVNDRARDDFYSYEANANINIGRLFPQTLGVQLPVYVGYMQSTSNPEYDPYDLDVNFNEKLNRYSGNERDRWREAGQDYKSLSSFNISNMRITGNPAKQKKPMPWHVKNFYLSYSYLKQYIRNPLIESDENVEQKFALGYTYSVANKPFEPFKKRIKSKSPWLLFIKDFNFNYLPNSFTFRNNLDRSFSETILRDVDEGGYEMPPYYYKNFVWNRNYNLRWDFTRSISLNYQANNISRIDEPFGRINTPEKRDSLWNRISDFGRNTYYFQKLDLTYNLPTSKFPFLSWTTINLVYNATYDWTAASLLAYEQGNIITNTQLKQVNGAFNFTQLYNRSRHFREANKPVPKKSQTADKMRSGIPSGGKDPKLAIGGPNGGKDEPKDDKKKDDDKKKKPSNIPPKPEKKKFTERDVKGVDTLSPAVVKEELKKLRAAEKKRYRTAIATWRKAKKAVVPDMSPGGKALLRLASMLKNINVDYSENAGTVLPGYMDSTTFFGSNMRNGAHGLDFALGAQPGATWMEQQMRQAYLSKDSLFNGMMQQRFTQAYNIRAALEPIRELRIDVNWSSNFTRNQAQINKFDAATDGYNQINPYYSGSFDMTYIGLSTMFRPKGKVEELDDIYRTFSANRTVISNRLGAANPYTNGTPDPMDPNYKKGYGAYAQDVLIPSFIAAYSGRSASDVPLLQYDQNNIRSNPFKFYFPMPNWKLAYTGLAQMEPFASYLNSFTLNHQYTGKLSMNSFSNSLFYTDLLGVGFPSFIDSNSNNYIPFFQVPNITITENFGPFLGFDAAFKNNFTFRVNYLKSRMVALSLIDYQVSETRSSTFEIGFGYRVKGLVLPFSVFGTRQLKNDLNIKCDIGIRDDLTTNTYIAMENRLATQGQKVITIMPTIDYIVNDNLQLQFYFDRKQSIPYVLTAFPLTSTRAGLKLTYMLSGK
jgi:cell surface protein SprA